MKLPVGFDTRKLTYHDPCFIGRWNDIYDEPRQILNVINSDGVEEMRRNRNRSLLLRRRRRSGLDGGEDRQAHQ